MSSTTKKRPLPPLDHEALNAGRARVEARLKAEDDRRPRRFTAALLLGAVPNLFREAFKPVPEPYWSAHASGYRIDCPCGNRPHIERGELRACDDALSRCPRYFYGGLEQPHVAGSPER